jgi:hypothetical protein
MKKKMLQIHVQILQRKVNNSARSDECHVWSSSRCCQSILSVDRNTSFEWSFHRWLFFHTTAVFLFMRWTQWLSSFLDLKIYLSAFSNLEDSFSRVSQRREIQRWDEYIWRRHRTRTFRWWWIRKMIDCSWLLMKVINVN